MARYEVAAAFCTHSCDFVDVDPQPVFYIYFIYTYLHVKKSVIPRYYSVLV